MATIQVATLFLLVLVAAASALSRVLAVPYPILLVVVGSLAGFVPGMPHVTLDPDVVLFVLLPPLLYNAAYSSSLRDLRANARVITLSAVGLVAATTCLVAVAAHLVVPELPWAACFALGAVISPTDPLAATQIIRRFGLPSRSVTVVEGEALVNDGSALALYQTAVAAVGGTAFTVWEAGGLFLVEVAGGIAVGIGVALVMNRVFRFAGGDRLLWLVLSLATGYLAYLPAEQLGLSGVLATVTAGLVTGHRAPLISTASVRLSNGAFWEIQVFLLNAVLFASVGLQLPGVLAGQHRSVAELAVLGVLIAATTILARLVWTHVITFVVRAIDRRPSQRARRSSWRARTVSAWCGLRGAVSLAAALALPADFPERDLLIFLALCVIGATLVGQGLTLPWLIRTLRVTDDGVSAREELHARKAATRAALDELQQLDGQDGTRPDTLERMRGLYEFRHRRLAQRAGFQSDDGEDVESRSHDYQRIVHTVINAQRRELIRLRDTGEIGDEAMNIVQRELDLEEERLDS
jgi:CPA1 family monovalent cation:H+ antiporter